MTVMYIKFCYWHSDFPFLCGPSIIRFFDDWNDDAPRPILKRNASHMITDVFEEHSVISRNRSVGACAALEKAFGEWSRARFGSRTCLATPSKRRPEGGQPSVPLSGPPLGQLQSIVHRGAATTVGHSASAIPEQGRQDNLDVAVPHDSQCSTPKSKKKLPY